MGCMFIKPCNPIRFNDNVVSKGDYDILHKMREIFFDLVVYV